MEKFYQKKIVFKETEHSSIYLYQHKDTQKFVIKRFSTNPNDDVFRALKNKNHPNLPTIYEVCSDDSGITVLEEYIEGKRLIDMLSSKPINRKTAFRYACDICDALIFLHSMGIIHRDIKPSNVIIKEDGTAVLIDLSIARFVNEQDNDTQALGTPGFAAPEQFGIFQSNNTTDIYSLGVLLNIMLTGSHPSVDLPKGRYKKVVEQATSTQISKRFKNAEKMKSALKMYR